MLLLVLFCVFSCYLLEELDLLDDLRVLLTLLEVSELVIRSPLAAVLPLSALLLCTLGFVLFFCLIFAVVEGVGGLALR